jgi:hypothetical protein
MYGHAREPGTGQLALLSLDPQPGPRSGLPRIGERVAEDFKSLVGLDVDRDRLVARRVVSHYQDPLSARIPEEFDVDASGMPCIELEWAVHALTMARMRLSTTGRWEGPPSPKVRGFKSHPRRFIRLG